jgi:uncharacterized protein YgiM (DUF1202 family)
MRTIIQFAAVSSLAIVTSLFVDTAQADTQYISIRKAALRQQPQVWSPVSSTLNFGDAVEVIKEENSWLYVQKGGAQGYIHESSVDDSPVKAVGYSEATAASSTQGAGVSLATKGFDAEVEKNYRQANASLRFDRVNALEKRTISPTVLAQFMRDGQLLK